MDTLTLAQYSGTSGAVWDFAPLPAVEPVVCRSWHPHPQSPSGQVLCAVDHAEQATVVHGAQVGAHWFSWSTEAAVAAWARVDRCTYTYCGAVITDGLPYCSPWCAWQDKHAGDEHAEAVEAA